MFHTFIAQPVFNLLVFIYALIPGHDLGVSIIIFTAIIRLALWPLVKRQLHQAKAMRKLQPELKKIKEAAKGDRQKEARLQMELYKEHEIKPFSTVGTLIIQLPIFIALYQAVRHLINDPNVLFTETYSWVRNMGFIQDLSHDISKFDHTLLGIVDLTKTAIGQNGVYVPALIIAILAAISQYYQSKIMMVDNKDSRKLSQILKDAAEGKQTDQSEIGASISRMMMYFLPFVTFIFAISVPAALSVYILTSSTIGYFQQAHVLKQDEEEMHELAIEDGKDKPKKEAKKPQNKKPKKPSARKKRRKR